MKKVLTILSILMGAMMIFSGANKLFQLTPMPELTEQQKLIFGAFGTIKWLMPLVALAEIVGGILVAIPKTRAVGALVLLPILVGIIAHHLTFDMKGIIMGAVLSLIEVWILIDNKERYMQLVK